MNKHIKYHVQFLLFAVVLTLSWNITLADDLNPPDYRGDPLSIYAHWEQIPGTPLLVLTGFNVVEDTDPTTILYPMDPSPVIEPEGKTYEFYLPNFIDEMPVKYMRLQLTWQFDPTPPLDILISGAEGDTGVPGDIVFTSPVSILDPTGSLFYQYYDIEFHPNPDQERWLVILPDNAFLVQAVADTVSTVPEPTTLLLLGFGGLALRTRRV